MGVHAAQEQQLLDRHLHRSGCRLHRRRRQPRQPGHPEPGIVDQQPVQVAAHLPRQKVTDLLRRQRARTCPGGRDHLHQRHHTGPRHVRADQELRRLVEQQGRGVVLHRPVLQELLQLLQRLPAGRHRLPVQVLQNHLQMIATSLRPPPVLLQRAGEHRQLIRQPQHRGLRHRPEVIGDESQPRQRAQLNGQPQPRRRPTPAATLQVVDQPQILPRQREEPDQLLPADVRVRPQPLHLLVREEPSRQPQQPPRKHRNQYEP